MRIRHDSGATKTAHMAHTQQHSPRHSFTLSADEVEFVAECLVLVEATLNETIELQTAKWALSPLIQRLRAEVRRSMALRARLQGTP